MAKKLSTQAQLKLSVDDALAKIKKLSTELKEVKAQVNQPLKLDVQVDMSKFNSQMNDIKKVLGGSRTAKGQFSTIASDIRAIRTELTNLSKVLTGVVGQLTNASKEANNFSNNLNRSFSGNNQQITGLVNNVEQFNVSVRRSSEEAKTFKNNFMGAFSAASTGLSSLLSGIDKAYSGFRSIGTTFLSTLGNIANQSLEMVGFSVSGMVDEAMEQERKLQQSQIGFGNMFKGQDTNAMIKQVRQTAAISPSLNSGDLADYINQLGAVAGGDFTTAFNATMGILKTVSYGGGDANSQMGYIIKNVRDVMAKGKATAVDVQQFNRAMPLLTTALEEIGASEFLKDGQLTITKDNADKLMEAFAKLNTPDNPAYNIFEQTSKTLAGIQEEFKEATASAIAEGLEGIGFFDALANVARDSLLPEIQGDIQGFFKWVGEISKEIDWKALQQEVGAVVTQVKGLVGELASYFKDNFLNTESLKLVVQIIGEFIKGLLEGAKSFLEMINGIRQYLGDEGLLNLANALGKAVTRGFILSKVLSLVAGGFETFSHVAQASFFLTQNMGKGVAGAQAATSSLGFLSGSTATGSFASNIGEKVAAATGLRYTTITNGVSKVGGVLGKGLGLAKTVGAGVLKGGAATMLTSVVSDLIKNFNLLGDASSGVANVLKVGGAAIGGAITGKILGPIGMLGGALIGAIATIKSIAREEEEKKAKETGAKIADIKQEGGDKVLQAAIDTFRSAGYTFDEGTDAAVWTKNQVIEYLNSTPADKWDAEKIYDRFVSAYRQKLGHETMVKADNKDGFWDLPGEAVEYITKNEKGEDVITDWGTRLVKLIREYNMVGYDSMDELESTSDQTLVREYLANDQAKLNAKQIEYLEAEAKKFEAETGNAMTATKDKITSAIEEFGGLDQAITAAKDAGDEAFAKTLEAYRELQKYAQNVINTITDEAKEDKFWSKETAKEYLGEKGAERYEEWKQRSDFNDVGNANVQMLKKIYGTAEIEEVMKKLGDEKNQLEKNAETSTGVDHTRDVNAASAIQRFMDNFQNIEEGDWDKMAGELSALAGQLIGQERYGALGDLNFNGQHIKDGMSQQEVQDILNAILKWFGQLGGSAWVTAAHGGEIKPIYRAMGGGSGRGVDIVPAYLQPGEFVQRQSAVQKAGLSVMNALNNGDLGSAYKLIGAKLSNSWNNSRTTNNTSDNRRWQHNQFFIRNNTSAGKAGTRTSLANHLALGY